jgi:hypothetical protein
VVRIARIALRVVFGCCEVMVTFLPTKALISVDFPEFGLPMMATNPDLNTA